MELLEQMRLAIAAGCEVCGGKAIDAACHMSQARAALTVFEKWLREQDKRMVRAWTLANEIAAMRQKEAGDGK